MLFIYFGKFIDRPVSIHLHILVILDNAFFSLRWHTQRLLCKCCVCFMDFSISDLSSLYYRGKITHINFVFCLTSV
jgi:hypothetical protein